MAITNGYATLDQFKMLKDISSNDAADDIYIEDLIERASRMVDSICGRWFYADTQTRYFDVPRPASRELVLDADLLTVTTLTNGDTTVITSADYNLLPFNGYPKRSIKLKASSVYYWAMDSSANVEGVISVAGTWGFVSRSATDARSARVILNTAFATLRIAQMWYHDRFGQNLGGNTIITAAGIVQTPAGAVPKAAYDAIAPYIERL